MKQVMNRDTASDFKACWDEMRLLLVSDMNKISCPPIYGVPYRSVNHLGVALASTPPALQWIPTHWMLNHTS
jgi:hypothetical protein